MQGIASSLHEVEEARDLICTQLFEVFQHTCHRDEDLQTELRADLLSKVSGHRAGISSVNQIIEHIRTVL